MSNAMSLYARPEHKAAARSLGYALTLGTSDGWHDFTRIITARLEPDERAGLAWASLRSLEPHVIDAVAEAVLGAAGLPLPPSVDPFGDANFWADKASPAERRAYCLAAYLRMSHRDQADFLEFAQGRAAAE